MADLKFVKTRDISKVKIQSNQLIFTDDGSMYFDYSDSRRLHNSGGATLSDYIPDTQYYANDMVAYNGIMYRALVNNRDNKFVVTHWQKLADIGDEPSTIKATQVEYEPGSTGLEATTLQAAIDEMMFKYNNITAELDTF